MLSAGDKLKLLRINSFVGETSSWPPHFRGEGPKVQVIDFLHPDQKQTKEW